MQPEPMPPDLALRPGERLVAGRLYVFDHDALGDWLAVEAKLDAPRRLAGLGDEALTSLYYKALRLAWLSGRRDSELAERVEAERARRRRDAERAA